MKDRKKQRQKDLQKRLSAQKHKNYLPILLITFTLWGILGFIVYFVDPSNAGAVPLFIIFLSIALVLTFSMFFANTRRGVLMSVSIVLFLILRYLGVGNLLNLALIAGVAIAFELYFSR